MKKIKLGLTVLFILAFTTMYAQVKNQPLQSLQNLDRFNTLVKLNSFTPTVSLGIQGGFAKFEGNSGLAVGMFAEIRTESFSMVPQANYWKLDKMNNFEMAGIARMRFRAGSIEPYVDGGIGINFLDDKVTNKNETKLGLDLGGGLDFVGAGANYSIFIDAKYKIIVGDPNIKGIVLCGGIKFSL
ncbi:MAG: hypothetical protein HY959_03430 [Ignavibacteriae bacterium]|nr:hypothetical protein [Ignavibacteriota bacterium]